MHRFFGSIRTAVVALATCAALGAIGCSDSTSPGGPATGTLRVDLVDAPAALDGVTSLEIVFREVRVHRSEDADGNDDGWFVALADTLPVEQRTFDLLELVNGVFATLGEVELDAGRYTQVRVLIESATVTVDSVEYAVLVPSGQQTGLKLVGGFDIDPDELTAITLDFDVARSLHETPPGSNDFVLRPTIRMEQTALTGRIAGTVVPTGIDALVMAVSGADTVTSTLVDPVSGDYVLMALPAGFYDVIATATGYVDSTRAAVAVVAGEETADIDFELIPE